MDIGPTIRRLFWCATCYEQEMAEKANNAFTPKSAAQLTESSVTETEAAWETASADSGAPTMWLVAS